MKGAGKLAPVLLLAYAAIVLLRMPHIILAGRFWGEEGTVFFRNAWTLPAPDALLFPYGGYLNLVANAAALSARWILPLDVAPWFTTVVALLIQLIPPALLVAARDPWLVDFRVRLMALLLLLFVPASEEVWLQTVSSQFELSVAAGLLLALDVPRGPRCLLALAVLVLAPLAGPGAIAFVPLFLLRAVVARSVGRTLQAAAILLGSTVQLLWFFTAAAERGLAIHPEIVLPIVTIKHLLRPFVGWDRSLRGAAAIRATLDAGHWPWAAMAAPLLVALLLTFALWRQRNQPAAWLFAAAALAAGVAYVGAVEGSAALLDPAFGERYAFVPQSLAGIGLLAIAARRGVIAPVAAALCLWLVVVGARDFTRPMSAMADGPAWRDEVAAWRADPSHALRLWPLGWTVHLPPVTVPGGLAN